MAKFYAGKNITLYIGSTPGGGYDSYARLVARHLGEHIPGHPTIVPVNMPGAGSNKLAYYIYAVAPKDGTAIGAIFPGAIMEPLIGDKPVQHDPSKFSYVGSANNEVFICIVRSDAPVKTFKDVFTTRDAARRERRGRIDPRLPAVLDNLLGAKFKLVLGYPGSREMMLAIEQGEVEGVCGIARLELRRGRSPTGSRAARSSCWRRRRSRADPELTATRRADDARLRARTTSSSRSARAAVQPAACSAGPTSCRPACRRNGSRRCARRSRRRCSDPGAARRCRSACGCRSIPSPGEDVQALVAKIYATPPRPSSTRLKQAMVYSH